MGRNRGSRSRSTSIPPGIVSPWLAEESSPKSTRTAAAGATRRRASLAVPARDREGHVMSAKPERIRERYIHAALDLPVRGGIEVALRIGSELIDGRGNDPAGGGQQRRNEFQSARSSEQVTGHGFRGAEHQLAGVLAEDRLDGLSLRDVALRCGGAVRVDVPHVPGV